MAEFITLPVLYVLTFLLQLMNGLVYTDEDNVKISQNNVRLRKHVFWITCIPNIYGALLMWIQNLLIEKLS